MPAGIENFALGLVQGMNARKAEQRQNEQDQMRKQEFNLQQEARQFDLTNAKASADNSRIDRERALALQARGDAFNKHFGLAMSSPDDGGAILALANGFNDPVFGMPYRAVPQTGPDGKPQKDKDGKFIVGYLDPSGRTAYTQSWSKQDAMDKFRGINDAAGQFDKLRESQAKDKEKESDRAHDMAKIDRTGAWDVQRATVTADAALDRALSVLDRRAELGLGGDGAKSKYSLDGEIKSIFGSEADVSPISRRVIVQQIEGGIGAAAGSKDVRDRAQGWNQAYQGFLGAVRSADAGRKLSPRQIEEQAKFLFDKHLRETYGVGYDDAMTQLGLVDPKTLPKKGRAQQPAPAGNSPKTPAQNLVDPVKQSRDTQNAYKQANNFITGGGF
jgi:hypothetical protein